MTDSKLPIGIQSFEDLRKNGYVYVDKTAYIWKLVNTGKTYFLSRPRRFGKSLLVSTLEAYFLGKKELFKGLSIYANENTRNDSAWQKYPVIHFSFAGGSYQTPNGLTDRLSNTIRNYAEQFELTGQYEISGETLPVLFLNLIEKLYQKTGKQVVVLVDEYDKPMLENMGVNPAQEEKNRQVYKDFFGILKDEDQYLRFIFITGVTKFAKISIFSDLNQPMDISLSDDYAALCGITQDELITSFPDEIQDLSDKMKASREKCVQALARMYDGYRFSPDGEGVYNPFSLLCAFHDRRLRRYWFETGTPSFLVKMLHGSSFTAEQFTDGVTVDETSLTEFRAEENGNAELSSDDTIPLFYQSGYLTIRDYDDAFQLYTLSFPNDEVKYGFLNSLLPTILGSKDSQAPLSLRNMTLDLENGDLASFFTRLEALFAAIPYVETGAISYEQTWRNNIFIILTLLGQKVSCEVHSSTGRSDCVVETRNYIYVMEFKLDKSADEALQQIKDRNYTLPYQAGKKTVFSVGVNFSSQKRNIEDWKYSR